MAKPPPGCREGTNIFKWLVLLEDLYRTFPRQNGFSSLCYKDKMTVSTDVGRCFCGQLTAETERQKGRAEIRVTASGFLVIESFYLHNQHIFSILRVNKYYGDNL